MVKPTNKEQLAQVRKSLSVLRKKGLYNPKNARAKPTDYGIRLARKFSDVATGKAFVLKADKATIKKLGETYQTRNQRVVVPKFSWADRATINKKTGEVRYTKSIGGARYRFRPANVTDVKDLPKLKKGQTYLVPFKHGNKLSFVSETSLEDIMKLVADYEKRGSNSYKDIAKYIQIGERVGISEDDGEI